MGTQASGSNDLSSENLVSVDTGIIYFSISGELKKAKPEKKSAHKITEGDDSYASSLFISCVDDFSCACGEKNSGEKVKKLDIQIPPTFFEQTDYLVEIECSDSSKIEFYHEDPHLRKAVHRMGRKRQILCGNINFRNNVGYSDLVVKKDGHEYLRIRIEVYPSKISYRSDFEEIRNDVAQEVYGLIFDYLQPTYYQYGISKKIQKNDFDYGVILDSLYGKISRAIETIIAHPNHVLNKEYNVLPFHKVKYFDNKSLKWLAKHPEFVQVRNGNIIAERMLAIKKVVTYDTKENRLTKLMLLRVVRKIHIFRDAVIKANHQGLPLLDRLLTIEKKLQGYLNTTFLRYITEEYVENSMSLVFTSAPGYKELYRCNLLLQHGLEMTEQILNVHLKQISELYEYWCFIKLNSILRKHYQLTRKNNIVTLKNNFVVDLVKGNKSSVRYINPKNNEKFEMRYNHKYDRLPTVAQQPDNILCLYKMTEDGREVEYKYIFDAKYKIAEAYEKTLADGKKIQIPAGPKDEDINTMHRYRDAIIFADGDKDDQVYKKEMFGAYVLFPCEDEDGYQNHTFYKSIAKVNVGGLPFLPGHTVLVEKILDELINESPFSANDRSILPRNIELKLADIDWNRNVLVGGMFNATELAAILDKKEYQIKCGNVKVPDIVKYVALYQTKTNFSNDSGVRYWGEVKNYIKKKAHGKQYYIFKVDEWKSLKKPIEVNEKMGGGVRYASKFALQYSALTTELFADTKELWRVLYELRHTFGLQFAETQGKEFLYDNVKLAFVDDEIEIRKTDTDEKIDSVPVKKFKHNTGIQIRNVVRNLMQRDTTTTQQ